MHSERQQSFASSAALLLRASAGTGKTFQLSNRILWLLLQGESAQKILAATFARKAAAEILERVLSRLAAATANDSSAERLARELGLADLSRERCQECLLRVVDTQQHLSVCTLDSFCVRVAKLFSRELGLYQDWTLLEGAVEEAPLVESALAEFFVAVPPEQLQALLRLVQPGRYPRSVRTLFTQHLKALAQQALEVPESALTFLGLTPAPSEEQLQNIQERICALALPTTKAGAPHKSWLAERERLATCVREQEWIELLAKGLGAKALAGETRFYTHEIADPVQEVLQELLASARSVLLHARQRQTQAALDLLQRFASILDQQRHQRQAFGFSEVKRLLARATIAENVEHLYYRLDSSVRHILLDEFQDTSMLEWRVLLPLIEEILSQSSQERSFFCVGDSKQAIYQWRGGSSEIFEQLPQRWPQLEQHSMACSYRSAPAIMQFINRVFLDLPENAALQSQRAVAQRWVRSFSEHQSAFPDQSGYVEIYSCGEASEEDAFDEDERGLQGIEEQASEGESEEYTPAEQRFRAAARCVQDLQQRFPSSSVGLLFRSNAQVSTMHTLLASLGVRASAEGASSLLDSAGVQALLALAEALAHPADSLAPYHVQRALDGRLQASLETGGVALLRERVRTFGVGACFAELAEQLARRSVHAEAIVLRQFARAVLNYRGEASDYAAFVRWVEGCSLESDPLPVRCMTMHKSKGLEFDFVVLPELGENLLREKERAFFLIDRSGHDSRIERLIAYPSKEEIALDPQLQEMKQKLSAERVFDSLSLLYVALTRARRGLHIFLPGAAQVATSKTALPLSGAEILRASVADLELQPAPAALADWVQGSWQMGQRARCEQELAAQEPRRTSDIRERPAGLVLKIAPAERPRVLPRVTPSSLEGEAQNAHLAQLLRAVPEQALLRGIRLHQRLRQIEWLEAVESSNTAESANVTENGGQELELSPEIRALFLRQRYSAKVQALWRERSFCVHEGQQLLLGTFDRVVVWQEPDPALPCVEVIDFKSDILRIEAGPLVAQLTSRAEYYAPQMRAYRRAAAQLLKQDPSRIRLVLAFVSIGRVCSLE